MNPISVVEIKCKQLKKSLPTSVALNSLMVGGLGGHLLRVTPPGWPRQPVTTNERAAMTRTRFAILTLGHFLFLQKLLLPFLSELKLNNQVLSSCFWAAKVQPHRQFFVIYEIRSILQTHTNATVHCEMNCLVSGKCNELFGLRVLRSVKICYQVNGKKV